MGVDSLADCRGRVLDSETAEVADSVTDEDNELYASKEPGDEAWNDDDGLFEMACWW